MTLSAEQIDVISETLDSNLPAYAFGLGREKDEICKQAKSAITLKASLTKAEDRVKELDGFNTKIINDAMSYAGQLNTLKDKLKHTVPVSIGAMNGMIDACKWGRKKDFVYIREKLEDALKEQGEEW